MEELSLALLLREVLGGQWARLAHSAIVVEAKRRLRVCFEGKEKIPGPAARKDVGQGIWYINWNRPFPSFEDIFALCHYTIWLLTNYVCTEYVHETMLPCRAIHVLITTPWSPP
jgi:hypothetical protein